MTTQWIELNGFPRPSVARILSPNGRPHHMAKYRATLAVQIHVALATRIAGLKPMHGLVTLRAVYTFPQKRVRDIDNWTGILKGVIDALVRGGWLPDGDDAEHLRLEPVEFRVERGARRLVMEFESE